MENNEDSKEVEKNPNKYPSNYPMNSNNINDSNYINYINQPFLPQPYTFGQNNQTFNQNQPQKIMPSPSQYNPFNLQRNILYISNLPYNTNETDIKLFFKNYGNDVTLMGINTRHLNENETNPLSAKVIFKDSVTANKARIEMNLRKLKGHAVRLMWEERDNSIRYNSTSNLFIKGVPFHVQPREVYEYFIKFGDISSAILKEDNEGNHLGYGYVTYYDPQSAENAIKNTNGKMLWGGGPIQVDYFKKKNERISTTGPELYKLYISNFPGDFTESKIAELTQEFGVILSITLKTEKVGRRYALVCFKSEDAANRAKESLEGKNVCGYNLLCKIVSDKGNPLEKQFQKKTDKKDYNKRFFQRPTPGINNGEPNMCNLIVKNIPYYIKEQEFKDFFSKYGKIVSAKLVFHNVINQVGGKIGTVPANQGFGYVCYETPEIAKKVIDELNGNFFPGYEGWKNPLVINYFLSKSQKALNDMMDMNYQNNYNYYRNNNNNNQNNQNNTDEFKPEFNKEKYKNLKNEDEKKEYLGSCIFYYIFDGKFLNDYPQEKREEINSKITGILLEAGLDEVANIFDDKEMLNAKIYECLSIIKKDSK